MWTELKRWSWEPYIAYLPICEGPLPRMLWCQRFQILTIIMHYGKSAKIDCYWLKRYLTTVNGPDFVRGLMSKAKSQQMRMLWLCSKSKHSGFLKWSTHKNHGRVRFSEQVNNEIKTCRHYLMCILLVKKKRITTKNLTLIDQSTFCSNMYNLFLSINYRISQAFHLPLLFVFARKKHTGKLKVCYVCTHHI